MVFETPILRIPWFREEIAAGIPAAVFFTLPSRREFKSSGVTPSDGSCIYLPCNNVHEVLWRKSNLFLLSKHQILSRIHKVISHSLLLIPRQRLKMRQRRQS